ncbi:MAG: alanine--glyoxylate aminotransferase family protein [Chloroflexota bacterium]|nr:alanine--glyoxylate aminotransferase family protein [Chloroflexota bacterium]
MKNYKLMIPGPVDVEDEVLAAISSPSMPHYGAEWLTVHNDVISMLQQVFQTENDVLLVPGPGSAALDAALGSMLAPGDLVCIPANGFFGRRLARIAETNGLQVLQMDFAPGQPVDPEALRRQIAEQRDMEGRAQDRPRLRALAVVHHETATGVLNPLKEIAAVAREFDLPIIVDAVSSLCGVPLPVDEWGIDVCVTVANKCLATPPGIAILSANSRAWQMAAEQKNSARSWYLNLNTWRYYMDDWAWHPYPTTLPTNNIIALQVSLKRILAGGLEAQFARYVEASTLVRQGLLDLGFEMFVADEWACPVVSAVRTRPDVSADELHDFLRDEHGILIAGGLEDLRGIIFRVGHMGKATSQEYSLAFLRGVEDFLRRRELI